LKKVNGFLTYATMLDVLILAYIHLVVMLIELQKVLSQVLMSLFVQQDYHSPIGINSTKNYGCESLTFLLY